MKISPADGALYIVHAQRRQVYKVLTEDEKLMRDDDEQWAAVVGNGQRCIPNDNDECGDGGPAKSARLAFPKGLAIAADKTMYITDSRNVRVVSPDGRIGTLVGNQGPQNGPPKPLPCKRMFEAGEVQLQWPTKLELSPLDGTLHIVDDTMLLRLTTDLRLELIAGRSPLCNIASNYEDDDELTSGPILDFAFSSEGELFLAEKRPNPDRNIVHRIDQEGQAWPFAGTVDRTLECACKSVSNCTRPAGCSKKVLAPQVIFGSLSSLALTPDNTVHVADNSNLQIISLRTALPEPTEGTEDTQIADTNTRQLHTFNRYGQHVKTHNLETGSLMYTFVYTKNTALGKLSEIADALGNKVMLQRDYTNRVKSIENTYRQKFSVTLSRLKYLTAFGTIELEYQGNTGLLTSKRLADGNFAKFAYDGQGRVSSVSLASGETFRLQSSLVNCGQVQKEEETKKATYEAVRGSPLVTTLCVRVTTDTDRNKREPGELGSTGSGLVRAGEQAWLLEVKQSGKVTARSELNGEEGKEIGDPVKY